MADVPPRSQRLLWHERLYEVDRHHAAGPKDLRGEPAHGGEIRLEESDHRLLPSCATSETPTRRGIREWWNRAIREPSAGAAWQGYLVDGRRRAHRLVSRRARDRRVRHQCGAGVYRGWHSIDRAASPSRPPDRKSTRLNSSHVSE